MAETIVLENVKKYKSKPRNIHIPSSVQADTLLPSLFKNHKAKENRIAHEVFLCHQSTQTTRLIDGDNPSVVSRDLPKGHENEYGRMIETGSEKGYYSSEIQYFAVERQESNTTCTKGL